MDITTTARHYDLTPALREYAENKVRNLTRYFDHIVYAHIVFALEKYRHSFEVTLHANGKDFNGKDESEDMYASVDRVVDKLERQILKHKGKRYNKKSRKLSEIGLALPPEEALEENSAPDEAAGNDIVPADPIEFPRMSLDEAVTALKQNGKDFGIFSNTLTERLTVLYRRDDGSLGVLEA